jgi:glucose 1-dehydrogenase
MNEISTLYGMNRLQGKSALVTGANSGIGKAIAMAFAAEGARVAINYITDRAEAERVVEGIREQKGVAIAVRADVSNEEEVAAMFARVCGEFGTLDILINNAGIQRDAPLAAMPLADWQKVIDVNLTGSFLCSREAARVFLKKVGACTAGSIIFISSVHETIPWGGHCNYAASKGGEMLFMRSIAQELGAKKIRINGIAPGAIKTSINAAAWQEPQAAAQLLKLIPYQRVGEPLDVATVAVWLASDESAYVHGTTIYVDGGMTLYPGFAAGG